ncbi:MAG TPA: hypothetical protein VGC24_00850, partial [Burkholderiaceae bacterium]
MKNRSTWYQVRLEETQIERALHRRYSLRLHGVCIGLFTLALTWGASHGLMRLGVDSLALRYLVSLGIGYLGYLLVLRMWAALLLRRENHAGHGDVPDGPVDVGGGPNGLPSLRMGGGGDFAGGGAGGDFGDAVAALGDSGVGDVAGGALEAAASADEGAVIAVPVVALFLLGSALVFGAGALLMLYFGWEVLLAVAVEMAFSFASARAATRMAREGWLSAATRLTWKPLLGALLCAVALGAAI